MKIWYGVKPDRCDICTGKIRNSFIDGKSKFGPWAIMCPICFAKAGIGLGIGKGAIYKFDGKDFVKMEG